MIGTIYDRRSIRKYKTDAIDEKSIRQIVEAAMFAPTARNLQPWHFIIVDDRSILNKIMGIHPYVSMLENAPIAIVVCGDTSISQDYYQIDCAAATQNMLLAAKELGLGSCWCGIYPREERIELFEKLFELSENIKPFSLVIIGVPDEQKPRPIRYRKDRIHRNKW
jgi:nitroreductase